MTKITSLLFVLVCSFCGQRLLGSVYVFSVGANQSKDELTEALSYADKDAKDFADAMRTVGRVSSEQVFVQVNPTSLEFHKTLDELAGKLKTALPDSKFVFFFSGHADERGLHFKDGFFSKSKLHNFLATLAVRTKVAIIDSCFAGLLTDKGIREVDGFGLPKLNFDEPSGSIFLAATSPQSLAFESQRMGGGVFSRNLIEGLYGKADMNHDGVVTATELYEFAYRETQLTSYLLPSRSLQKPEFVANLKGRGAVALSFPATALGRVRFFPEIDGVITLYAAKGLGTFEVEKAKGSESTVSIPSGAYNVVINQNGSLGTAELRIEPAKTSTLSSYDVNWQKPDVLDHSEARGRQSAREVSEGAPFQEEKTIANSNLTAQINNGPTLNQVSRANHVPEDRWRVSTFVGFDHLESLRSLDIGLERHSRTGFTGPKVSLGWKGRDEFTSAGINTLLGTGYSFFEVGKNYFRIRTNIAAGIAVAKAQSQDKSNTDRETFYSMSHSSSSWERFLVMRVGVELFLASDHVNFGINRDFWYHETSSDLQYPPYSDTLGFGLVF